MSLTNLAATADEVQKVWAPITTTQLVATNPVLGVVNRGYEGAIRGKNDSVYVNMINPLTGETRTAGTDADIFDTEKLKTTKTTIKADKLFNVAVEVESLVELQSMIDTGNMELRSAMTQALNDQINKYIYGFVKSASDTTSVTAFTKTQLQLARVLAGSKKWPKDNQWFGMFDPSYWSDVNVDTVLANMDYVTDGPLSATYQMRKLLDFNCVEDNSLATDQAIFFHKNWLYFVMQTSVEFKLSDLHSNKRNGYLLSAQIVGGAAKNAYAGDNLHYLISNSAWAGTV